MSWTYSAWVAHKKHYDSKNTIETFKSLLTDGFRPSRTPFQQIPNLIQQNGKVPRIVESQRKTESEVIQICAASGKNLFLQRYNQLRQPKCLLINADIISTYTTFQRLKRMNKCWKTKQIWMEAWGEQCLIAANEIDLDNLHIALFLDSFTDPCFMRKKLPYQARFLASLPTNGSEIQLYLFIQMIVKWICVSRSFGKGIATPDQPHFALYDHFTNIVSMIGTNLVDSYQKMTLNGKIEKPCVLRSLRSFVQLNMSHCIHRNCLVQLNDLLQSNAHLKCMFPQVIQILKSCLCETSEEIQLTLNFNGIPAHAFLYGIALSSHLPLEMKKSIVHSMYIPQTHTIPHKCKKQQADQTSTSFILYEKASPLLQLIYNLEQCSFLEKKKRATWQPGTKIYGPTECSWTNSWIVRWPEFVSKTWSFDELQIICVESDFVKP